VRDAHVLCVLLYKGGDGRRRNEDVVNQTQYTVSEAARQLTDRCGAVISPKVITELFYRRVLDDAACPIVGGRRLIPGDYVRVIERALRSRGYIDQGVTP
jgi:hypothetical protein